MAGNRKKRSKVRDGSRLKPPKPSKKGALSGRAIDIIQLTLSGIQKNEALSDKSFEVLKLSVEELREKYNLSFNDIVGILRKRVTPADVLIPVSVFDNDELSALETICKYLKENLNLTFHRIAELTKRDDRTIWATYSNAVKKRKKILSVIETPYTIPISLVANRRLSVLEAVVSHLKDEYGLRYNQIGKLLNRDERNIWAAYAKAGKRK